MRCPHRRSYAKGCHSLLPEYAFHHTSSTMYHDVQGLQPAFPPCPCAVLRRLHDDLCADVHVRALLK